jgi:hypothetical protein
MKKYLLLFSIIPFSGFSQEVFSGLRMSGNYLWFINDDPEISYRDRKSISTAITLTNFFGKTIGVETEISFRTFGYEVSFPHFYSYPNPAEFPVSARMEGTHAEVPLLIDIRLINHQHFDFYAFGGVAQALLIHSREKIYFSNGVIHEMNLLNNEISSYKFGVCALYKTSNLGFKFRFVAHDFKNTFDWIINNQIRALEGGFEIDYRWNN